MFLLLTIETVMNITRWHIVTGRPESRCEERLQDERRTGRGGDPTGVGYDLRSW